MSRGLFTQWPRSKAAGLRRNDPAAHAQQLPTVIIAAGCPPPSVISVKCLAQPLPQGTSCATANPFREEKTILRHNDVQPVQAGNYNGSEGLPWPCCLTVVGIGRYAPAPRSACTRKSNGMNSSTLVGPAVWPDPGVYMTPATVVLVPPYETGLVEDYLPKPLAKTDSLTSCRTMPVLSRRHSLSRGSNASCIMKPLAGEHPFWRVNTAQRRHFARLLHRLAKKRAVRSHFWF